MGCEYCRKEVHTELLRMGRLKMTLTLLPKDLLHIWSWSSDTLLVVRRRTMTKTKTPSKKDLRHIWWWSSENYFSFVSLGLRSRRPATGVSRALGARVSRGVSGALRAPGSGDTPWTLRRTPPFSGTLKGTLPGTLGPEGPERPL